MREFVYDGRAYRRGDAVTVTPIEAASLAWRMLVDLNEPVRAREIVADAIPEPVKPPARRAVKPRKQRQSGVYTRRDMRAKP